MRSSTKRISLVTGANEGIGFDLTRHAGHRVLFGARDVALGKAAAATLKAEGVATRSRVERDKASRSIQPIPASP
jgi:NADP-dependent 3-hydroxy acid dehydrogenase YdfG